jgi:nucleoid-associated protein YgaU
MKKIITLLIMMTYFVSCSVANKTESDHKKISNLDDGMYLNETSEEGVAELVIPEVLEYVEIRDEVKMQASKGRLELGAEKNSEEIEKDLDETLAQMGTYTQPIALPPVEKKPAPVIKPKVEKVAKVEPKKVKRKVASFAPRRAKKESLYWVKPTDTLKTISIKLYGSEKYWKKLALWNGIYVSNKKLVGKGDLLRYKTVIK